MGWVRNDSFYRRRRKANQPLPIPVGELLLGDPWAGSHRAATVNPQCPKGLSRPLSLHPRPLVRCPGIFHRVLPKGCTWMGRVAPLLSSSSCTVRCVVLQGKPRSGWAFSGTWFSIPPEKGLAGRRISSLCSLEFYLCLEIPAKAPSLRHCMI